MNHDIRIVKGRTCRTCVAYEDDECMNLVSIRIGDGQYEQPKPDFYCPDHKSLAEDQAEDAALALFRTKLGLPPRQPNFSLGKNET